jgi:hypothetical protein
MPCLRRLSLSISNSPFSSHSTPKDIVLLSNLTHFRSVGYDMLFLDVLVAGLSAQSLQDVDINFIGNWPPIVHLSRFINEDRGTLLRC